MNVTLTPGQPDYLGNPTWDVHADGVLVGNVYAGEATREDRTPGRMYVNSRWTVKAWYATPANETRFTRSYSIDYRSRVDAVGSLIGFDYDAARAAKIVRVAATPAPATDAAETHLCPVCDTAKAASKFPTKSGQPGVRNFAKCRACR